MGKQCTRLILLLTHMVFFWDIREFLQLSRICLLRTNWAFLHLENYDWQEVFLSKTNSLLTVKQCGRCSCFWQRWFSFKRSLCFFKLAEKAYSEQTEPISTLKHLCCQSKEQCRRYHNTWLQTILQSNNNKNSMVLAQKQTGRPVEQNRGPRYEATQL
jgi:hypothetical protein